MFSVQKSAAQFMRRKMHIPQDLAENHTVLPNIAAQFLHGTHFARIVQKL